MIKLGRVGYKAQPGETVVDISVKNNPKHVLAPTWDMVLGFQRGTITWDQYVEKYMDLLRSRWANGRAEDIRELARESKYRTLVLLCFCADETRCHRSLAKAALELVLARMP